MEHSFEIDQRHQAAEKLQVLEKFRYTMEALLPRAVRNNSDTPEAPLRWRESNNAHADNQPECDVWAELHARCVSLTHGSDFSRIYVGDKGPEIEGVDYIEAEVILPIGGPILVRRSMFAKDADGNLRGRCIDVWPTESQEDNEYEDKRSQIKEYVFSVLDEAVSQAPVRQRQYLEDAGVSDIDSYIEQWSVCNIGSSATRSTLDELGVHLEV